MSDFRKWPKTTARTIIDFDRLVSRMQTQGDTLICVPVAMVDIIRKLLRDRGLWRTTYAKDQDDIGYNIPTPEEFKPVEDMISEFLWETSEMRCQDLITALNGIAASISACCGNSGPGYVSDGEGGVWYGTEVPVPIPDTFGGEGEFETEAAFAEHRCLAANNIVSGLILTLNSWSVLSLAGLLAGGQIVAFFVAAPPLALLLVLAGAGFAFGAMSTLSNHIDDNRQDWVCAIYNADTYAAMLVEIDLLISEMVIELDIGAFEIPVTDLIHAMLSTDVFNTAFSVVGLPPVTSPIDCSLCEEVPCGLTYDWVADGQQGWQVSNPNALGASGAYDTTSLTWTTEGMHFLAEAASGTRILAAKVTGLDYEIQPGDTWEYEYQPNLLTNTYTRITLVTDQGNRVIYGSTPIGAGHKVLGGSLATWVGETIETIEIYHNNSIGSNVNVTAEFFKIVCAS